jgi:signal transduction histidine kinase
MNSPESLLANHKSLLRHGSVDLPRPADHAPLFPQAEDGQRALLNILDDFVTEKNNLELGQRAILNILSDFDAEKDRMEGAQRAVLNILDDSVAEKMRLEEIQGAMVNILDDFSEEKGRLEQSQGAVLNILDDFEEEKNKVELANLRLENEVEERKRAEQLLARRAEDLARSNDDLQQFAYVASHDLQEPLRMVASYTQLLAKRYKGKLDADADEFISFAVDGAGRMQVLIQDLLAYSRVGTAGISGQPLHRVPSENALKQALSNLHATIDESGAVVTSDPLPVVTSDESQLAQVLQNLVGNAIKYRGSEAPRVHVSASKNPENQWIFSVRDNGMGIDPQYFERIFVIFQRLHGRKEFAGTGIGLAICKKIVERMGGRIWVESQPDQGSIFCFTQLD